MAAKSNQARVGFRSCRPPGSGAEVPLGVEDAAQLRRLHRAAVVAARRAYAPYSKYHVGCAIESVTGAVHAAANVENASYGLTICAERAAIGAAVAAEGRRFRIRRAFVVVLGTHVAFPPCGACRQCLAEFGLPGAGRGKGVTEIFWPGAEGLVRATLGELLPGAFRLES